jgi:hypothetical protein
MTSLEGVTQRGDIGPDLLLGMLASDLGIPPVTVVNGTLMARRSWNTAVEPAALQHAAQGWRYQLA